MTAAHCVVDDNLKPQDVKAVYIGLVDWQTDTAQQFEYRRVVVRSSCCCWLAEKASSRRGRACGRLQVRAAQVALAGLLAGGALVQLTASTPAFPAAACGAPPAVFAIYCGL